MILYVKNANIDILKYDNCISSSINSRIYAYSWYLNCVADNWDALILNDYEAVMPLPTRKKIGLNYVYQVPWVQQLGVFFKGEINQSLILKFIKAIPKKFVLVDYLLNADNHLDGKYISKRINYILCLNADFDAIKNSYNKNRRRISVKKFDGFVIDKNTNAYDFLALYKTQTFNFEMHKDSIEKLERLLYLNNDSVHIWSVINSGKIIGGLVWLQSKTRITYLLPLADAEAKNNNVPTFLINELIKENQNTNVVLDFEGSMIEGVAKFYKSFGAKTEIYYRYKKRLI
ncbi:MAG: hypothetical protein L3J34_02260 [Flavobacteriaceae bacterium]|nr:hypothetical protein [Flavobacteriaceae bacterium]